MKKQALIQNAVIGFAIGDALGVPVEGKSRNYLRDNPVESMIGYGTYDVPAGSWSDDTSMVIATLEAIDTKIDYNLIMQNFCDWRTNGAYTPCGVTFDCGNTINTALYNFRYNHIEPLKCGSSDENSIGNGSLMRILPFVLYEIYHKAKVDCEMTEISNASALTHSHPRAILACKIYTMILFELCKYPSLKGVKRGLKKSAKVFKSELERPAFDRLLFSKIESIDENSIESSGYVVHTLEAAIWCVLTSKSYKETVLKAVNLGRDTDTIAAIAGSMAGIIYGTQTIPREWLNTLLKKDYLFDVCKRTEAVWTR